MGIKGKIAKGLLIGGAIGVPTLGAAGAVQAARKAGTIKLPYNKISPQHPTHPQYLTNRGFYQRPDVVKRRNLMKLSSLKEEIKTRLEKRAVNMPPAAVMNPAAAAASGQAKMASPFVGATRQRAMNFNAIPGAPMNAGAGMPASHLEGQAGAAMLQKAASSDPLKRVLIKQAFLGSALSFMGRNMMGRAALGAGAATATGGDPLSGAVIGGLMGGGAGRALGLGAAGGLMTSAMKARNQAWNMPGEEEGMYLGQIDPSHYTPAGNLGPVGGFLAPA